MAYRRNLTSRQCLTSGVDDRSVRHYVMLIGGRVGRSQINASCQCDAKPLTPDIHSVDVGGDARLPWQGRAVLGLVDVAGDNMQVKVETVCQASAPQQLSRFTPSAPSSLIATFAIRCAARVTAARSSVGMSRRSLLCRFGTTNRWPSEAG